MPAWVERIVTAGVALTIVGVLLEILGAGGPGRPLAAIGFCTMTAAAFWGTLLGRNEKK
jgi:hypothetical protein